MYLGIDKWGFVRKRFDSRSVGSGWTDRNCNIYSDYLVHDNFYENTVILIPVIMINLLSYSIIDFQSRTCSIAIIIEL